jgi:hypoxanthine phosphoribosyltransferase
MDYMALSSYGEGTASSGVVTIQKDLTSNIAGRHVLVVEDVIDSGLTLRYLCNQLQQRNPASISVAALLRKELPTQGNLDCQYLGFVCPNEFVVGYGLDYAQRYRNLRYIGVLKQDAI